SADRHHPSPPYFPTRRSSDLAGGHALVAGEQTRAVVLDVAGEPQPAARGHVLVAAHHPGQPQARPGVTVLVHQRAADVDRPLALDRKSTRLNSSHVKISYAVF